MCHSQHCQKNDTGAPRCPCAQVISPETNAAAEALLAKLHEWQERARLADPMSAKRKRRLVSGMREVGGTVG